MPLFREFRKQKAFSPFRVGAFHGTGAGDVLLGAGARLDLDTARTIVVNTVVVLEVFYLFNVRYLHMTSITLRGALGTRTVLLAIAAVVLAQAVFTYAPLMQALFQTRPVALLDGLAIVGAGIALMVILEIEKAILRRLRVFEAA